MSDDLLAKALEDEAGGGGKWSNRESRIGRKCQPCSWMNGRMVLCNHSVRCYD